MASSWFLAARDTAVAPEAEEAVTSAPKDSSCLSDHVHSISLTWCPKSHEIWRLNPVELLYIHVFNLCIL